MTAPPVLVLVEPQDIVNIASAVRIAKNFATPLVRLVNPRVFDPYRIEGIAHNTGEIVDQIEQFPSLEAAIADCVFAVALSARERTAKRQFHPAREAAALVTERSQDGKVALVFGREDAGLTNDELDRCHAVAAVATNPDHRSLNLAQAVAIMSYECFLARQGGGQTRKPPRRRSGPATGDELSKLFHDWFRTLWAVDFFKSRNPENVMRSLREVWFRADLDHREAKLLRAVALEVVNFLVRRQVSIQLPAELSRPGGAGERAPDSGPD